MASTEGFTISLNKYGSKRDMEGAWTAILIRVGFLREKRKPCQGLLTFGCLAKHGLKVTLQAADSTCIIHTMGKKTEGWF